MYGLGFYQIQGPPIAEDEVDRALDVAAQEEVPAHVVEQRVLGAQDLAVHKRRLVARDPQRHRLHPLGTWEGLRGSVLRDGRKIKAS